MFHSLGANVHERAQSIAKGEADRFVRDVNGYPIAALAAAFITVAASVALIFAARRRAG